VVVGLGPAGADLVPAATLDALNGARHAFLRTARHPAVAGLGPGLVSRLTSFDHLYEEAESFDDVYAAIVARLVESATASTPGFVAYGVPGSPLVAERTVTLLRGDPRIEVEVRLAPSFLDLAWDRLGIDPVDAGVRLVDAASFAVDGAGERGPLMVAQCHDRLLLSAVKLAVDEVEPDPGRRAVVLHHLGLDDEVVRDVPWEDLDRVVEPDHLTALWIPRLAAPIAGEVARLDELVRALRVRCPWDRVQTHSSLARHLLEEAYETIDALDALDAAGDDVGPELVAHLEEELGDVLFQVVFHSALAAEEGRFTLADVARSVHDKLVARHPHVFGDVVADTPDDVAANWEQLKKAEKGRSSITEGIPEALPALALVAKLQRKAQSLAEPPAPALSSPAQVAEGLDRLVGAGRPGAPEALDAPAELVELVGELLFAVADAARQAGVDPESALRAHARRFRSTIEASE